MQLSNQLYSASDGHSSCLVGTYKQHAHDPIPVSVQFSVNADGTFQYYANDMSWSTENLFYTMYKALTATTVATRGYRAHFFD
jgi:hypothetical protein